MGEHKKELWLYMFTVNREIEVDQTTEAEVNGEKVKVTKKSKNKSQSFLLSNARIEGCMSKPTCFLVYNCLRALGLAF